MVKQLVLFEHAAGYALFEVKEFEEIGAFQAQVEESVTDFSRFHSVVKLAGFSPFTTAAHALENINAVSEGIVSDDLLNFLKQVLPKSLKKGKVLLGVFDAKLGASISEALPPLQCSHVGIFPEILRGIRLHFAHLVKGLGEKASATAQLGLGHAYSRAKIKFNVNRVDNMIIQSIALLDMLDKDINTFSMRIREWYSYHFPELFKIVPENYTFARLVYLIKDRKNINENMLEKIEEITMDSAKAEAILEASKLSMGMDISEVDLKNIELFASRVISLADYRKHLAEYLGKKMGAIAPNLATLVGDQIGARLIAHAGSLTNLAKYPASTVQILGAEKALFRALKTRSNTPKYGLLYHSTFIGRAGTKNKGRISRYLANKCSVASRIDCFTDFPSKVFGEKLRQQVEDRLKFYEEGEVPKKNIDVMKEAILEVSQLIEDESTKKKDKKKRKLSENGAAVEEEEPVKKKKKKKEKIDESLNGESPKKRNKKEDESFNGEETIEDESPKKKKKKKKANKSLDG